MNKQFQKGRAYERIDYIKRFHFYMGWMCLILAPVYYFLSVWSFNVRVNVWAALTLFGGCNLFLGYSEKKELKKYGKV